MAINNTTAVNGDGTGLTEAQKWLQTPEGQAYAAAAKAQADGMNRHEQYVQHGYSHSEDMKYLPSTNASGGSISDIAMAVIRGDYGNGEDRKKALAAAGYDYATIQAEVNRIIAENQGILGGGTTSGGSSSGGKQSNGQYVEQVGGGTGVGKGEFPSRNPNTGTTPSQPETEPQPSVEDRYKDLMGAANERLKQAYIYQQGQLQSAKDEALREAYIKQKMNQRAYPEQLSAAGINGGAAQGVVARGNSDYAKQRTDVYNTYLNGLNSAGQTYQQGVLGNNESFLASMAAYQQAKEEMEIQHKYDLELAKLKSRLG